MTWREKDGQEKQGKDEEVRGAQVCLSARGYTLFGQLFGSAARKPAQRQNQQQARGRRSKRKLAVCRKQSQREAHAVTRIESIRIGYRGTGRAGSLTLAGIAGEGDLGHFLAVGGAGGGAADRSGEQGGLHHRGGPDRRARTAL